MPAPEPDWRLMQSIAGRYYYLDVNTNDVRLRVPPAVRASPSHEVGNPGGVLAILLIP